LLSFALPGGVLLLAAAALAQVPSAHMTTPPVPEVYLWASLLAGLAMAWRFQSSRALFALLVLWLGDRSLLLLAHASPGGANAGYALVGLLLPLNLVFFSVIGECGLTLNSIGSGMGILSIQAIAVAVLARGENVEFARWAERAYLPGGLFGWTPLPQLALLAFAAALAWLGMRMTILRKPLDTAFFWSTCAGLVAMHAAAPRRGSTLYFATAVLIAAAALVENSYLLAFHDELTGLPGRRALNQAMLKLADRYAIAMVDVDHFKKFNDTYGHDAGDQVLRMVAGRLALVGGGGKAYRFGGEEFAIVFPASTADQAGAELEELREAIAAAAFMVRGPERSRRKRRERRYAQPGRRPVGTERTRTNVTVSIGVAECGARLHTPELVIEAADQALYRAKDAGRNRVEIAGAPARRVSARPSAIGAH
jgi:diguanylate cyclase (GGDEF)-like protein